MKDIEQSGKKEMASSNILIFLVWISFVLHTGSMAYAGKCYSNYFAEGSPKTKDRQKLLITRFN